MTGNSAETHREVSSQTPLTLRCEQCGEETLILRGCANDTWLCGKCGAAIRQAGSAGVRQKPHGTEIERPLVPLDPLHDELARLAMEQGLGPRFGRPRAPRLYELSGSFTRIPGDPRVPKLVRLYGTAFTMLGAMMAVQGVYSLFFSGASVFTAGSRAWLTIPPLAALGYAILQIATGNALRRGRRAAVYGAALVYAGAVGCLVWKSRHLFAAFLVGLSAAPLIVSAFRHWDGFRQLENRKESW